LLNANEVESITCLLLVIDDLKIATVTNVSS